MIKSNLVENSGSNDLGRVFRDEGVDGEVVDDRLEGQREELGLGELEVQLLQRIGPDVDLEQH